MNRRGWIIFTVLTLIGGYFLYFYRPEPKEIEGGYIMSITMEPPHWERRLVDIQRGLYEQKFVKDTEYWMVIGNRGRDRIVRVDKFAAEMFSVGQHVDKIYDTTGYKEYLRRWQIRVTQE